MHSGKVHPRKNDKRIMAGKNDFTGPDCSPVGFDLVSVNREDKGVFVYSQLLGERRNQLERVKLRLVLEFDGTGRVDGKMRRWDKRSTDPQFLGGKRLFFQHFGILGINICVGRFEIAVDLFFLYQTAVCLDGVFVGLRIQPGFFFPPILNHAVVKKPVLRGEFCGCFPGLSARDAVCLQYDHRFSGFLKFVCG